MLRQRDVKSLRGPAPRGYNGDDQRAYSEVRPGGL